MKKKVFAFILPLMFSFLGQAQTLRYFEFSTNCGHGNWQDTSFIASTSSQAVIDSVLANLARPLNQRNFISGSIDYGHGGHNHNANHWFLWHFIPNQWSLVELAIEVCDGCPYTDVDADTAYWIGTIGSFCPWSGRPVREVANPATGMDERILQKDLALFPNPAKDRIHLKYSALNKVTVTLYNSIGQELKTISPHEQNNTVDISSLARGLYYIKIQDSDKTIIRQFVAAEE